MARPRRPTPAHRYHLTLDRAIADRLGAYAKATRRPISTTAAALISDALTRVRTEELTALALHRELGEPADRDQVEPSAPRWEWPIDALLADTEWWDRWLPRLNELSGRRLAPLIPQPRREGSGGHLSPVAPAVDERGYTDVLAFLLPPIVGGEMRLTWRSPDYPAAARREDAGRAGSPETLARAQVWEPVIRHVAEALCALESTAQAGVDAYLRLRAEAEITGPWARILRYLVGEEEPELPRRRLA
jgi:hypothetical protein